MRVLHQPIMTDIESRVGSFQLALRVFSLCGRKDRPPGDEGSLVELGERERPINLPIALMGVSSERTAELRTEASRFHGEAIGQPVEVVPDEIVFRAYRNVILLGMEQTWRDVLALSELFNSASIATAYGRFFDQRFVDYLAVNFEEIGSVNWRKFEALVAERFHREGFQVELGPGRNDNGVDIRVWESDADASITRPTLIIQCKRENRKIEKVVVKALAADVEWEGAEQGMLAATVDWSPGAREVVKTRKYPLAEVNREVLKHWVVGMRSTGSGLWLPG